MNKLQKKLLPGRKPIIQIAKRSILQPPKIISHPKIIISGTSNTKPIFPDKSMKHVEHLDLVNRPLLKHAISEITLDHVKLFPGTEHVNARPQPK